MLQNDGREACFGIIEKFVRQATATLALTKPCMSSSSEVVDEDARIEIHLHAATPSSTRNSSGVSERTAAEGAASSCSRLYVSKTSHERAPARMNRSLT